MPEEEIVGSDPTDEELFYVAWGDQIIKDGLPFVNQVLRQLVTLSAAVLVGAVAFYDKQIVEQKFMVAAMALLLASVIMAVVGIMPYRAVILRRQPYNIKRHVQSGLFFKKAMLWCSAVPLVLALLALLIGVIAKNP